MKKLLIVSVFIGCASGAFACNCGKTIISGGGSAGPPQPKQVAKTPTISNLASDSITVDGKKTYAIDDATAVSVNGTDTTIAALKPGMKVLVSSKSTSDHALYAVKVTARIGK